MLAEYDFSGGVRGKHAKVLKEEGYTIRVRQADGTTLVKHIAGEGTVVLAPDVREYFPTSKAVNRVLRQLIALVPEKHKASVSDRRGSGTKADFSTKNRIKR